MKPGVRRLVAVTLFAGFISACAATNAARPTTSRPSVTRETLGEPAWRVSYHDDSVEVALFRPKLCQHEGGTSTPCGEQPIDGKLLALSARTVGRGEAFIECRADEATDERGITRFIGKDCSVLHEGTLPRSIVVSVPGEQHATGDTIDLGRIEPFRSASGPLQRTNGNDASVHVDPTAQASAAGQATTDPVASKKSDVAHRRLEVEAQCASGKADACYGAAMNLCWPDWWPGDPEPPNFNAVACYRVSAASQALSYFHKACELRHELSCRREKKIIADDASLARFQAQQQVQGQSPKPQGRTRLECSQLCANTYQGCVGSCERAFTNGCTEKVASCKSALNGCYQGCEQVPGQVARTGGEPSGCVGKCQNQLSSCMAADSRDYDACVRPCRDNGCQSRCVEDAKKRQHACHERFDEGPCRSRCN